VVAAFTEDGDGELIVSGFTTSETFFSTFEFEALTGTHMVVAWSDENDNEEIDAGDYLGVFPEFVLLGADEAISGVDINIIQVIDLGMTRPAGVGKDDFEHWRGALEEWVRTQTP
jgi:hypothetical protein